MVHFRVKPELLLGGKDKLKFRDALEHDPSLSGLGKLHEGSLPSRVNAGSGVHILFVFSTREDVISILAMATPVCARSSNVL